MGNRYGRQGDLNLRNKRVGEREGKGEGERRTYSTS